MSIEELLERLNKVEGVTSDLVDEIRSAFKSINGEAAKWRTELRKAEERTKRLDELIGKDDKNAETVLKTLNEQIATLTKERDDAIAGKEKSEKDKEELSTSIATMQRKQHFADVAKKLGADEEALLTLLTDVKSEDLKIKDSEVLVTIEGKESNFTEFLKTKPLWVSSALFPGVPSDKIGQGDTTGTKTRLPSGSANPGKVKDSSVSSEFLKQKIKVDRFTKP